MRFPPIGRLLHGPSQLLGLTGVVSVAALLLDERHLAVDARLARLHVLVGFVQVGQFLGEVGQAVRLEASAS